MVSAAPSPPPAELAIQQRLAQALAAATVSPATAAASAAPALSTVPEDMSAAPEQYPPVGNQQLQVGQLQQLQGNGGYPAISRGMQDMNGFATGLQQVRLADCQHACTAAASRLPSSNCLSRGGALQLLLVIGC